MLTVKSICDPNFSSKSPALWVYPHSVSSPNALFMPLKYSGPIRMQIQRGRECMHNSINRQRFLGPHYQILILTLTDVSLENKKKEKKKITNPLAAALKVNKRGNNR